MSTLMSRRSAKAHLMIRAGKKRELLMMESIMKSQKRAGAAVKRAIKVPTYLQRTCVFF